MQEQRISTILWRGKWIILASVLVGALAAILITKATAKVYEANAVIQVNAANTTSSNQSPADVQAANQVLAQTYATLIGDRSFLQEIRRSVLGGSRTTGDLLASVSAHAVTNTALVDLTADDSSPARAQALANDVANAFVTYVANGARDTSTAQQAKLRDQIATVSRQIRRLAGHTDVGSQEELDSLRGARTTLQTQLATVIASGIEQGGSVKLAAPATASAAPIRPRPTLNLLAGILLGLLVGTILSWLRLRLDRGLHSAEEVEEILEVPVLASVPVRKRFSHDDAVLGEAFDILRTNLAFIGVDRPLQVVTFSSPNPREGKSSTVEGLAWAAGRGGLTVVIVDADVRTRTLSTRLGFADASGLTNVVVGAADLDDAIVELAPGVSLVPAGPMPPNPPSLLASARMRELIEELRGRYSLILIDSPPVTHLADPSILAAESDGVVLVARVGLTARTQLADAAATLRRTPTPVVGCVLLERREVDETYYPAMAKGVPGQEQEPLETI